jgi:very-short-patch-repair endonuclease
VATENKVSDLKLTIVKKVLGSLEELLSSTQSPIEELFLLQFLLLSDEFKITAYGIYDGAEMVGLYPCAETEWYGHKVIITPQYKIENYLTVDFKINLPDKNKTIIIECDGHEFHEKTKEQAQKDKKRDRKLANQEFFVLRFTGSEIYNDPQKCIKEVESLIIRLARGR